MSHDSQVSDWHAETFSAIPGVSELRELAALEEDWDTYGGLRPSDAALRGGLSLLHHAHERYRERTDHAIVPYAVSPLPTGGVEIEWRSGGALIRVDVGSEGELDYLVRRDTDGRREYSERHGCLIKAVLAALDSVLHG